VQGLQRTPPLDVSSVTLPEVHAGAPDQPFTMKADPGKLLFVYFGYTHCPDLCPTTMADLRKALKQLGPDASRIQTAFVTVDPQRDTADVLPGYLTSFVADAHALRTEDLAALKAAEDKFAASSSLTPNGDGTYEVAHTASSAIVDQNGKVVAEWPFGTSPEVMASDLRLLLAQQGSS
jgi:protein SCO1/2